MSPRIAAKSSIPSHPQAVSATAPAQPPRQKVDLYEAHAASVRQAKPIFSAYFNTKSSWAVAGKITPLFVGSSSIGVACLVALNVPGLREALIIGGAALLSLSVCHMAVTLVWAAIQRRMTSTPTAQIVPSPPAVVAQVVPSSATVVAPASSASPQLPASPSLGSPAQPHAKRPLRVSIPEIIIDGPEIIDGMEWWPLGQSPLPVADESVVVAAQPSVVAAQSSVEGPQGAVDSAVSGASSLPPPDTMLVPFDRMYTDLVQGAHANVAAMGARIGGLWKTAARSVSESGYKVPTVRAPLVSAAVLMSTAIFGTLLTVHMAYEPR